MVTYYLPLQAGSVKKWGTPTEDFWCCHGTLVEAHAVHGRSVYFEDGDGLVVCQYIPSELRWEQSGLGVRITQTSPTWQPGSLAVTLTVACAQPVEFALRIRLPWWLQGDPVIAVNGRPEPGPFAPSSVHSIRRSWTDETVSLTLPKGLTSAPLPDDPTMVAFMDGPVVLAGLCDDERTLRGDKDHPETILTPHNLHRKPQYWTHRRPEYRTQNQPRNIHFLPLHEVRDERYTVYFPVQGTDQGGVQLPPAKERTPR
jgi:DUF1680 family protein